MKLMKSQHTKLNELIDKFNSNQKNYVAGRFMEGDFYLRTKIRFWFFRYFSSKVYLYYTDNPSVFKFHYYDSEFEEKEEKKLMELWEKITSTRVIKII